MKTKTKKEENQQQRKWGEKETWRRRGESSCEGGASEKGGFRGRKRVSGKKARGNPDGRRKYTGTRILREESDKGKDVNYSFSELEGNPVRFFVSVKNSILINQKRREVLQG